MNGGRRRLTALILGGALFAGGLAAQESPEPSPFKPFDQGAFETAMKQAGATEAQLEAFRTRVTEDSPAAATDRLLQELHVDYAGAMQQANDGEPVAALSLAKVLAATSDPFLKAHARYLLGRVFLDADDPERAIDIFAEYLRESINRTPLDAEAVYYYAHALAEVPMPVDAVSVFTAFLKHFPSKSDTPKSIQRRDPPRTTPKNST
jgi:tetratricopeptide (TPR) repeat protein